MMTNGFFLLGNIKKTALTLLLIINPAMVHGLTVTYLTTYRLTESGQEMTCDNTLYTSDSVSYFYCYNQYRQDFISDSLAKCGANPYEAIDFWKREHLTGHTSLYVFKNSPASGTITVIDRIVDYYSYEEPMPEYNWTIIDSDTTILGHKAHKAITEYRGRKWTAYYTEDIAISDGPWKLCGLPGLILLAKDANGDFSFTAKEISDKVPPIEPLKHTGKTPITISAAEMERLKKLFFWDEDEFYQKVWSVGSKRYDEQGNAMPPKHGKACLIESL